jgi:hypothetical protein
MAHVPRQAGASSLSAMASAVFAVRTADKARHRLGTVRLQDVLDDGGRLLGLLFRHERVEHAVLELGGELPARLVEPALLPWSTSCHFFEQ